MDISFVYFLLLFSQMEFTIKIIIHLRLSYGEHVAGWYKLPDNFYGSFHYYSVIK